MSRVNETRRELESYEATKPGDYVSQYQPKINDVMNRMDSMGDFDYDPDADSAYQQYKSQYTRGAKLANENAQATASARTGGYGSSYGTQAGQSAYTSTMNNLDDVLDSLYNQSLSEYNTRKNGLAQELSGLQTAEKQDYQNYQNDLSNWYNGLQYRQNQYNQAMSDRQQTASNWIGGIGQVLNLAMSVLPYIMML